MVSRIAREVDFLIIYFEIQNSEFEFTFFTLRQTWQQLWFTVSLTVLIVLK